MRLHFEYFPRILNILSVENKLGEIFGMDEIKKLLTNTCNMTAVRPIMVDLPYPPIQVKEKNTAYANLLSIDYCGSVSEMTAITQYINNENRLSCEKCSIAKTLLGIAMAEMIHLQKLGEMMFLLGGNIDFAAKYHDGRRKLWTPDGLNIPEKEGEMLSADIEAEKAAIGQYKLHIKMINDDYINAVLWRIIKDEEYHIMLLQELLRGVKYSSA